MKQSKRAGGRAKALIPVMVLGSLPLLSPGWQSVLAQIYQPIDQPLPDPNATTIGSRAAANNPNGATAGAAIETTCGTGFNQASSVASQQAFGADCNDLFTASAAGDPNVDNALRRIAAEEISAQNTAALNNTRVRVSVLTGRLQVLRASSGYAPFAALDAPELGLFRAQGGGASADGSFGKLSGFINGKYSKGDQKGDSFDPGFDFKTTSLTAGLDYRVSESAVFGVALDFSNGDADFDNNAGDLDIDSYSATLYGSFYTPDGLFIDALMGFGRTNYDQKRNIVYTLNQGVNGVTSVNQVASSDPEADVFNASLGLGYAVVHSGWTISPTLRLDFVRNDVEGYTESASNPTAPGAGFALSVDKAKFESLTSNIGFQLGYPMSQSWGVLVPQARLEWVHEFMDDSQTIGARFTGDFNQQSLFVRTGNPDRNWGSLGLGLSAQWADGKSGFLSYETEFDRDNVTINTIRAGFRMEFD